MRSKAEMTAALREAGLRITRQRSAIIGYLSGRTDHPSARQIFTSLQGREPGLSLATVYNTIATLVNVGLLRELQFEDTDNRYDTNLAPHINLLCTGCGRIADFGHELPVPPEEIERRLGFKTTDFRLEYRGLCATCRRRKATNED